MTFNLDAELAAPSSPWDASLAARGTYAERLAVAKCDAEHALWALQHGADWRTGWSTCPRPDWLAQAYVLTRCEEGGGDAHRKLVGWLGAQVDRAWTGICLLYSPVAKDRVARCTLAVRAAASFARDWGRHFPGGPPDLVAFSVGALFDQPEAEWGPGEHPRLDADDEAAAVAHAALHAACSALTGTSPSACLRALAWASAWQDEAPGLAAAFAREFECPEELRCAPPE